MIGSTEVSPRRPPAICPEDLRWLAMDSSPVCVSAARYVSAATLQGSGPAAAGDRSVTSVVWLQHTGPVTDQ